MLATIALGAAQVQIFLKFKFRNVFHHPNSATVIYFHIFFTFQIVNKFNLLNSAHFHLFLFFLHFPIYSLLGVWQVEPLQDIFLQHQSPFSEEDFSLTTSLKNWYATLSLSL